MSSNRKKIIEPWEIVRETCGSPTKIAMFACFCSSKKRLFSLFLQILPFPAKIRNKKTFIRLGSTNPIFLRPMSSKLMKEEYPKKRMTDGQKKHRLFLLVWWRHRTEWNQTSPVCSTMWTFFFGETMFKSVHPFQRYCLKTVSPAHRPTLYKAFSMP